MMMTMIKTTMKPLLDSSSRKISYFLIGVFLLSSLMANVVRANDDCVDAVVIDSFPFQAQSDVTQATIDFATPADTFRNLTCGISTEAIGVWYRINAGSNAFLQATVQDVQTETKFITALFRGTTCDDMQCMLAREYQLENQRINPSLTWFAEDNASYFLHVAGINANEVGAFQLNVVALSSPEVVENDECITAQGLSTDGMIFSVNTTSAWPHGLENEDCSLHAYSRGAFYTIEGTGRVMAATLSASDLADRRLEMAVLTENCDECIEVSDFLTADDTPHTMEFKTTLNQIYVIVVSGERFSDVGGFDIQVEEREPAPGDEPEKLSNINSANTGGSQEPPPDATDLLVSGSKAAHATSLGLLLVLGVFGLVVL